MTAFLELIKSEPFIQFLSTFGLGVILVIYFVMVRDPKQTKFWQNKYDELIRRFEELSSSYAKLEAGLHPESRKLSHEQAMRICSIALDRDFYKLHHLISLTLDGKRRENPGLILHETVIDTNDVWSKFTSPFPQVPRISDLFGVYKSAGGILINELEEIMNGDNGDTDEKKSLIFNKLLENTLKMKREFSDNLHKLNEGAAVEPYIETNAT